MRNTRSNGVSRLPPIVCSVSNPTYPPLSSTSDSGVWARQGLGDDEMTLPGLVTLQNQVLDQQVGRLDAAGAREPNPRVAGSERHKTLAGYAAPGSVGVAGNHTTVSGPIGIGSAESSRPRHHPRSRPTPGTQASQSPASAKSPGCGLRGGGRASRQRGSRPLRRSSSLGGWPVVCCRRRE